jgi:hypothetical protein
MNFKQEAEALLPDNWPGGPDEATIRYRREAWVQEMMAALKRAYNFGREGRRI